MVRMRYSEIHDESAWRASDFDASRGWVRPLTRAMVAEVEETIRPLLARGVPLGDIRRSDFPLNETAALLSAAHDDLNVGRGFTVIGGWPVDRFTEEENRVAYAGLSSHFGEIVVQNHEGDTVVDVVDKGIPYNHKSRGYSSNKLLPFHTDGADYVGLLCLCTAAEGGLSILTSATTLYNEIARTRPGCLEVLMRGFYHHRRGQHDPGENPLSPERIPVFAFHDGLLHCCYNRNPIVWAQREGVKLTEEEVDALDAVDAICARPDMQLSMDLQKGDMQFMNNHLVLHSRTGYRDGPGHRRRLVRLWLNDPDARRNGLSLLDLYAPGASRHAVATAAGARAAPAV